MSDIYTVQNQNGHWWIFEDSPPLSIQRADCQEDKAWALWCAGILNMYGEAAKASMPPEGTDLPKTADEIPPTEVPAP